MTILLLLALGLMGFVMKLVALLVSWRDRQPNWAFVLFPVISPSNYEGIGQNIDEGD